MAKFTYRLINILNIDRLYLQSNESDSVESTKLPRCVTLSDHCTGNPLIDPCFSILIFIPNLINTFFIIIKLISYYFAYLQHNTLTFGIGYHIIYNNNNNNIYLKSNIQCT